MAKTTIGPDGTITVDGHVITPSEIGTASNELATIYKTLDNKKNWSLKNFEKLLAYGAGLVGATNGFSAAGLPTNIREWLIIGASIVVAALHVSTPATP